MWICKSLQKDHLVAAVAVDVIDLQAVVGHGDRQERGGLADPPEHLAFQIHGRDAVELRIVGACRSCRCETTISILPSPFRSPKRRLRSVPKPLVAIFFQSLGLGSASCSAFSSASQAAWRASKAALPAAEVVDPRGGEIGRDLREKADLAERVFRLLADEHLLAVHDDGDGVADALDAELIIAIHVKGVAAGGQELLGAMLAVRQGEHAAGDAHGDIAARVLVAHDQRRSCPQS